MIDRSHKKKKASTHRVDSRVGTGLNKNRYDPNSYKSLLPPNFLLAVAGEFLSQSSRRPPPPSQDRLLPSIVEGIQQSCFSVRIVFTRHTTRFSRRKRMRATKKSAIAIVPPSFTLTQISSTLLVVALTKSF